MTREEALHNLREARQRFIEADRACFDYPHNGWSSKYRAFSYENWLAACRAFREAQINHREDINQ